MISNTEVKEMALNCGAEIVGIAPIERFEDAEEYFGLKKLKSDVQSVIVMGFSINRGALRGVEEGTNWGAINAGSPTNPMIIPSITYRFSREFEQKFNYEATCLTKIPPSLLVSDKEKAAENTVSFFEYAAYLAGLGEISKGKFFLTKEFGTRQYFAVVLTDAKIECDNIINTTICDGCMECANACPYDAISLKDEVMFKIGDNDVKWNKLFIEKCFVCSTGAISNQYLDDSDFNILNRGAKSMNANVEPSRIAAACGRACMAHLEENILKNKFVNKFRTR